MADKHLIFLMHGIGHHDSGWSENLQAKLVEVAENYDYFKNTKLISQVRFFEITYDQIFRGQLESWQENIDNLVSSAPTGSQESTREALEWMDGMKEEKDNFLWTHVADAVLWKISPYLRNHILTSVAKDLVSEINKQIDESTFSPKYSIIGHSMASSVIHRTLEALNNGAWARDDYNAFSAKEITFSSIHMISNVSHYFEDNKNTIYKGVTRPGVLDGMDGYCQKYFNYCNKYDPICWLGRFSPNWDVNQGYYDIPISHIYSRDIHDYIHYLKNPKVHIPLLKSITNQYAITSLEEKKATREFQPISGEFEDDINKIKADIIEIQESINEFRELSGWIKGWSSYGDML